MKKRYLILLIVAALGIGVFFYNYWSYSCGRCNADSLLTISFPAGLLIAGNLLVSLALLFLKNRNNKTVVPPLCSCGAKLDRVWDFCPECGTLLEVESV